MRRLLPNFEILGNVLAKDMIKTIEIAAELADTWQTGIIVNPRC